VFEYDNVKVKQTTKEDVRIWLGKNKHACITHPNWDKKLWSKKYDDIVKYLIKRFRTTLDEVEYYNCIVYLWKHIPEEELCIPFKESIQYRRDVLGEDVKEKDKIQSMKEVKRTMKTFKVRK